MTLDWICDIGPQAEHTPEERGIMFTTSRPLQIVPKEDPQSSHERVLRLIARVREDRIAAPFDPVLAEIQTELHSIHFAQCKEAGT